MLKSSRVISTVVVCSTALGAGALAQAPPTPDNLSSSPQAASAAGAQELHATKDGRQLPDIFIAPRVDANQSRRVPLAAEIGKIPATVIKRDVLTNGVHGVMIHVTNNTDRPLVFDGDDSTVTISGAPLLALPASVLQPKNSPPDGALGKLKSDSWATVSSAVTVGALQTVIDQQRQDGPILGRYQQDEDRRRNEASRFGKRVLWPGDSSEGVLYFSQPVGAEGTFTMPVNTLYHPDEKVVLKLP